MFPEDLPAQFNAPSLDGGTAHVGGSEAGLGHLHGMGVIVTREQLHAENTE